ncbi:MAG: Bug family tripartite tricarboxylate transporter substrate binding protein [Thermodesulfobacteriota bacterium]
MKRKMFCLFAGFFVLTVFLSPEELLSAPYFEGKRITIVVGTNPGGGYDNTARIVAKNLGKHIPGSPTIIIENMPGAGHMIAANYIYNLAKPDGLTIGTYNRGLPFAQITKVEGVRFDMRKYSWIGSVTTEPTVFLVRSDLPYKSVDDLRKAKHPIAVATEGLGTSGHQFPILLKEFVGLNLKLVVYPSGSESRLAIERKEADSRAGSYSSEKRYIDKGVFLPLIRGRASLPEIDRLPVNEDLTTDPKGKTIMRMLSSVDGIARPFMCPPGTPANVMSILRDAFAKLTKDPQFQEDAKKLQMEVEYNPADDCLKVVNYLLNQPEDILKEFGKYVTF